MIYKKAGDILIRKLSDGNNENFIEVLSDGILFFATLHDESVKLVHLDKGGFKQLTFKRLSEKLKKIDLSATVISEFRNVKILIINKQTCEKLIQLRSRKENRRGKPYFRNYIEKKAGLSALLEDKSV